VARLRTFASKVKLEEDAALALVRHAHETLREERLLSSWHSILIAPLLPHLCGADAEEDDARILVGRCGIAVIGLV
jgi:hypothetical protein